MLRRAGLPSPPPAVIDALLAVALVALGLTTVRGLGQLNTGDAGVLIQDNALGGLVLVVGVAPVLVRRRWPLPATLVAGTVYGLTAVTDVADRTAWLLATLACAYMLSSLGTVGGRRIGGPFLAVVALVSATVGLRSYRDEPLSWVRYGAFELVVFAAVWFIGAEVRRRRREEARLEVRAADAEEEALVAAAHERVRIARELHDLVGHAISVISVQATVGEHLAESDPALAREALATIHEVSKEAMVEMRHLVGVLRDGESSPSGSELVPPPGLVDLDALVAELRSTGLDVSFAVTGGAPADSPGIGLAVYRIAQESLGNAAKHAPGAPVTLTIDHGADALTVEIVNAPAAAGSVGGDDPPGSGAMAVLGSSGFGIAGMRERVAVYGGTLTAGPLATGGFRVRARLPYEELAAVT